MIHKDVSIRQDYVANDCWFLDSCAESWFPMDVLLDRVVVEARFNMPWHGLDSDSIVTRLQGLVRRGDLVIRASIDSNNGPVRWLTKIDERDVRAGIQPGSRSLMYGLTERGGTRWEALFDPQWSRYVEFGYDDVASVTGTDRGLVHDYVTKWMPCHGFGILPDSIRWHELPVWQAVYWKVLHRAWRAEFRHVHVPARIPEAALPELSEIESRLDFVPRRIEILMQGCG